MIVDTDIRDMEAIQLVRQVRARHSPQEVPLIVFSMDSSLDAVQCVHAAGANDYVITPFDPAVLEAKIHCLMTERDDSRHSVLTS